MLKFLGDLLILGAELAGVIVAGVLMARKTGTGAALALGGFLALLLSSCGSSVGALVANRALGGARARALLAGGATCVLSALTVIGLVLLIVALTSLARRPAPPPAA